MARNESITFEGFGVDQRRIVIAHRFSCSPGRGKSSQSIIWCAFSHHHTIFNSYRIDLTTIGRGEQRLLLQIVYLESDNMNSWVKLQTMPQATIIYTNSRAIPMVLSLARSYSICCLHQNRMQHQPQHNFIVYVFTRMQDMSINAHVPGLCCSIFHLLILKATIKESIGLL